MIDMNNLLKQEDLIRKANLLKTLKTTVESLMFDNGAQFNNFNKFNGNLSIFCKIILDILLDGLIYSTDTAEQTLWSLIVSILLDQEEILIKNNSFHGAKDDFKQIYDKIENNQTSQNLIFEWILNSLRNHSFLNQLNFITNSNIVSISNYYSKNSFLLDKEFLRDFIIYIKAYENKNFKLLSKCKINLYSILNDDLNEFDSSKTSSYKSSIFDLNSISSSPLRLIESPKELGSMKTTHRRMHSFPNIQINLSKKTNQLETLNSSSSLLNQDNNTEEQKNDQNYIFSANQFEIPKIVLDEVLDENNDSKKEEDEFEKVNVFDFINEIQINSETSPLDKENSHFLLADLAICSLELIKSKHINNPMRLKPIKTSSSIRINNRPALRKIESLENSDIFSTYNSPIKFDTILENIDKELNLNMKNNLKKTSSLNNFKNYLDLENGSSTVKKTASLNCLNLSLNNDSSFGAKINEDVFKFSADSSYQYAQSISPINFSNDTTSNEPSKVVNEDGFEIVQTSNKPKSTNRKYSWENIDNLEAAETICKSLIQNEINKHKDNYVPSLNDFEYFVKFLEYKEIIQCYLDNFKPTGLNKLKKNTSISLLTENSPILSASSIYLSHLESNLSSSDTKSLSSIFSTSSITQPELNTTYHRVKSAALKSVIRKNRNDLNKQDSVQLNARIIGDDKWAPVREQLILNLTHKQKRTEQIKEQNYRCADCGIQFKDNKQIKTFNFCEYFCKYFCRCCHINQKSYIPAYIINLLDFRTTYEVSKKAKNFLEKIYSEPLITLESLNSSLFQDGSSMFSKIKKVRTKIYNCRSYINSCRFSQALKTELYSKFDDFIINDQQIYSIETLFKIKKTNYYEQLKSIMLKIIEHIKTCELCSQQGYICGLCNKNELLYPFELEKVEKCPNCLACYHKTCFKSPINCPRCIRKKNRVLFE